MLDKRYQQTPLGAQVAQFLRWFEDEWGASPESVRDYEPPLAHLAVDNPELDVLAFTPPEGLELLRVCLSRHWRTASPRTKKKIRSVWVSFFEWAIRECGLPGNPARALSIPKVRDPERKTFSEQFVRAVLEAQAYPADWLMAFLILRYGLRRSGIRNIQVSHLDAQSRELTVHTKGGRVYPLPIVEPQFWATLADLVDEAALGPDDYLIYRQDTRKRRVPLEEADDLVLRGDVPVGYANLTTRAHSSDQPTVQTVHRWWYRCLERAGLVESGTTAGANMHRGRHTAGRDIQRAHHDLKLTQRLLGHRDIRTTSIYADLDTADLADALRAMERDD